MDKYFKLFGYCKYLNGKNGGCIYNMRTSEMLYLDKEHSGIIERAQMQRPINQSDVNFLSYLEKQSIGSFYNTNVYIDTFQYGVAQRLQRIMPTNLFIERTYIQITEQCNLSCDFCAEHGLVLRRTGCAKWNNIKHPFIQKEWERVISELSSLGCSKLIFTGGNPFLAIDEMEQIIVIAKDYQIRDFTVQVNIYGLSPEYIDFAIANNIKIDAQIFFLDENTAYDFGCPSVDCDKLLSLLSDMARKGGDVRCTIVISKYNENTVDLMLKKLSDANLTSYIDYLFCKPSNTYSSNKYENSMYDRASLFGPITKESLSFYEKYNPDLFGKIYINCTGNITPDPLINDIVFGNVFENDICDILSSSTYNNLIQMNKGKIEKCKDCSFRLNCPDFRAIEYSATGKLNGLEFCDVSLEDDVE